MRTWPAGATNAARTEIEASGAASSAPARGTGCGEGPLPVAGAGDDWTGLCVGTPEQRRRFLGQLLHVRVAGREAARARRQLLPTVEQQKVHTASAVHLVEGARRGSALGVDSCPHRVYTRRAATQSRSSPPPPPAALSGSATIARALRGSRKAVRSLVRERCSRTIAGSAHLCATHTAHRLSSAPRGARCGQCAVCVVLARTRGASRAAL